MFALHPWDLDLTANIHKPTREQNTSNATRRRLYRRGGTTLALRSRSELRNTASMSASLSGNRDLPASQYDLSTYWGRVKQSAEIADPR